MALGGAAVVGAFDSTPATTVIQVSKDTPSTTALAPVGGTALTVNEIYRRSGPGVVQITSTQQSGRALGSGFVIDKKGHIVTNYHVVDGATSIDVRFSNDDTLKATLVGSDPSTDLALLRVDAAAGGPHAADPRRLHEGRGR